MPPFEIAIVHSGISTPLICTDYNRRVGECREAARHLLELAGRPLPGRSEAKLRDVPAAVHREHREKLPEPLRRRADHFFSEMERVDQGIAAWARGDLSDFGERMSASGESSIRNYECGCPELITIYEALRAAPGVAGARFSGAGYRGACVAIIDPARRDDVAGAIHRAYPAAHPRFKDLYQIYFRRTGDGARIEPA
jgi:galactokinase